MWVGGVPDATALWAIVGLVWCGGDPGVGRRDAEHGGPVAGPRVREHKAARVVYARASGPVRDASRKGLYSAALHVLWPEDVVRDGPVARSWVWYGAEVVRVRVDGIPDASAR